MKFLLVAGLAESLINFRGPLIAALQVRGFQVHVAAPNLSKNSQIRSTLENTGVVVHEIRLNRTGVHPFADFLTFIQLWRLMRYLRPQYVLAYTIKPVIYGLIAGWCAGVPRRFAMIEGLGFVFTYDIKSLSFKRRLLKGLVQLLYKFSLSKASRVVFLNSDDLLEFVEGRLLSVEKTYLLGGIGVDLVRWTPSPSTIVPLTFILVARLLYEKGVIEFVEAARLIKKSYPSVRFILLGDIDLNPGSLRRPMVQQWVSEGLLEWPGHVPVAMWLKQSSVFVLPSYREGVPMSTQEAMAMGLAIITTDVPGCRDTVIDGINGFLVPARNVEGLALAMQTFINCPHLIGQMGRESRRLAEEKFNVDNVNCRLIDMLCSIQLERETE